MDINIEEAPATQRDKGFTLVELLIVIVILGVLATVTVFAVRGITDQGQKSACSADKKTLEVATEAYFAQYAATTIVVAPATAPAPGTWTPGANAGATLKAAGLLRDVSTKYTVNPNGTLTAISPCT